MKNIGFCLVVFLPWTSPIYIKRSWCLYEFLVTIQTQIDYEIIIPLSQKLDFIKSIGSNDFIENRFSSIFYIDIKKATSFYKIDSENILNLIEKTIGFNEVNQLILNKLRQWILLFCNQIINENLVKPFLQEGDSVILDNVSNILLFLTNEDIKGYEPLLRIYEYKKTIFGDVSVNTMRSLLYYVNHLVRVSGTQLNKAGKLLKGIDKNLHLLESQNIDVKSLRISYTYVLSAYMTYEGRMLTAGNLIKPVVYEVFNNEISDVVVPNIEKSNIAVMFIVIAYYNNVSLDSDDFRLIKHIVKTLDQTFGKAFPNSLMVSTYYALILMKTNDTKETEDIIDLNLFNADVYLGCGHLITCYARSVKCLILTEQQKFIEAELLYNEYINHYKKLNYVQVITLLFNLGKLYAITGNYKESERVFREAIQYSKEQDVKAWKELADGSPIEEWFQILIFVYRKNKKSIEAFVIAIFLGISISTWGNRFRTIKKFLSYQKKT